MIYQSGNCVSVSTIRRGESTAHAIAKLRLSGTEFGDRITAYLTYYKVRGALRVFADANEFYRKAGSVEV